MRRLITTVVSLLLVVFSANAQEITVYEALSPERVKATASGELREFPAQNAVNGSGMTGDYHQADNLGRKMWISEGAKTETSANPYVKKGSVWMMCEFDAVEKIDLIEIWNHNQNLHTRRGLQKIYIEYSVDGKEWSLLKDGKKDHFIVPQAVGRKREPASLAIPTGGVRLKYLCVTADAKHGNHYFDGRRETLEKAREMNQNPNYYGLSEIRFSREKRVTLSDLAKIESFEFHAGQGYLKTLDGPKREFWLELPEPLYAGGSVAVQVKDRRSVVEIEPSKNGVSRIEGTFPAGYMEEKAAVAVNFASPQGSVERQVVVPAAKKWKLYFLPHSHLDIGYTHRQDDVMKLQIRNIEKAIDLVESTRNFPEGARYKWNAEATWAVDGFLKKYSGQKRERQFIKAVQNGEIGLDATLGSILTGISKQEELMHLFDDAHEISRITGVEINTAMMSDVPGQSWGLVTAMAENGVRYFSSGPNYVPTLGRLGSYGVGLYNLIWGDRPFWWESQDGNYRILYWQTGKGYSMFHGWLWDKLSVCGIEPIWDYLEELEEKEYPYHLTYLRYTIHGDNGPPDEEMPGVIAEWNEKYEFPKFAIGTTKELFGEMEAEYGEHLPVYSGDMTPIWEDGAASTARELAANRGSAERLNQYEILWSMTQPASEIPASKLKEGWRNVVLFSEHTWGAAASGPEPESEFTKDVWAGKKRFGDEAHRISTELFDDLLKRLGTGGDASYINVYNTNLWERSDIVRIEGVDLGGKELISEAGNRIPAQRLSDGSWVFYAENVPPLSSAAFRIAPAQPGKKAPTMARGNTLQNGRIRVEIDTATGAIRSFKHNGTGYEYAGKGGLNQYLYSGRNGENLRGVGRIESITVLNDGDVAATLRIKSEAPGCKSLIRDVTIYRDIDRIDVVNIVDKENVYDTENVRFYFPFNFWNPEVAMDLAMSVMHPERDQLVSANKNFYSIHNGLSVSDIKHGVYLATLDAPFVELGSMTADLSRIHPEATGWLNSAIISADVYSWVMNNRWRTNYKASQEGVVAFRYSIQAFDPLRFDLKRFGMERAHPLVAVAANNPAETVPIFQTKGNNRILLSTMRPASDGSGYIVRLQNASPFPARGAIESGRFPIVSARYCDNRENAGREFDLDSFWMKPYECATIKLTIE